MNDQIRLLDATDPFCSNNMIPAKCSNGKGFIVKDDSELWVNIKNNAISNYSTTIQYTLNEDGDRFEGFGKVRSTGNISVKERKKFADNTSEIQKELESKGIQNSDHIEITAPKSELKDFEYKFSFNQNTEKIEDQIIFSPFFNLTEQENPFKQEKRELPIDIIYPHATSYQAIIAIPQGYRVEELPLPIYKNTDDTSYSYQAIIDDENRIIISANYILKNSSYPASDYGKLKTLYNKVIQKMNQKLLLVKESEISMK